MREKVLKRIEENNGRYYDEDLDDVNGWIYTGGLGAAIANWIDDLENTKQGIGVLERPTHPMDENRTSVTVSLVRNMEFKTRSNRVLARWQGTRYRTPLPIRKRLIKEAKEYVVKWMQIHPPEEIEVMELERELPEKGIQTTLHRF